MPIQTMILSRPDYHAFSKQRLGSSYRYVFHFYSLIILFGHSPALSAVLGIYRHFSFLKAQLALLLSSTEE
jgi:hypothetical protein